LTENKDTMLILFELKQKLVQQNHLSTAHNDRAKLDLPVIAVSSNALGGAIENVGMVTGLLQLHDNVQERMLLFAIILCLVQCFVVSGDDVLVVISLLVGKLHSNDLLGLAWHILLDRLFDTSK